MNNTTTDLNEEPEFLQRGSGKRYRYGSKLLLLSSALLCGVGASAQYSTPATPAPYNPIALAEVTGAPRTAVQAGQTNDRALSQNPYLGGVAAGKLSATPVQLSLNDAVAFGLKQNLAGVLATDAVTDARGQRWQALSELLPHVITDTGFGVHQVNVKAAFGLTIPGEPPIIGPFGYFDSRAYLTQSVFDWTSIERARSSQALLKSAEFSSKDARELIVLVIVSNYLLAIADQSEVESATSQRDTAKALFQQASDQKTAGLASTVDVLRSQVQLQSREQKLIVAQNNLAKQKLVLARAIGLPSGQKFEITTQIPYQELTPSGLDESIQSAYTDRADFQSQMNQVGSAELERKAASAERYPSLGAEADYGLSGVNPGSSHGTVDAAATLRIPIFQGGRVHGDVLRADASLTRERQRLEDLRARIDQEVRDAYLDLDAAAQEVSVEKSAVTLATRNLEQSRDRFTSGVTDNIEVVQAQDALAIASDAYIASLYSYNLSKISLARSTGVAESRFAEYVEGK
ncbi:TolC family protein [Acidicapsa acidisoli]|uniref:TolC family protein n=1 Tax=Acidicapsa acidisoli TaxID=1615681 RepID=UPI0021E0C0CF|nr:TolC family protein [Acidicapsa acidisoli]